MFTSYLSIFLASSIGILLTLLLRRISFSKKFLIPHGVPLVGGIAMGITFLVTSLFVFFLLHRVPREASGIIFASLLMLVFGVLDDWRELSVIAKFLVQIVATLILIFFGVRTQIVYIGALANLIITFIWILAITNALNHLDVMDGVAGGVALIISIAFLISSFINRDITSGVLSLTLAVAILTFLLYNLPPAKVYMGNSGSHFLGFVLSAIAITISYAPMERKVALLSPILILGLPLYDTAFLVLIRLGKKKLPFKKSNDHMVLRFLALGYSKKRALLIMLSWNLFFVLCGIVVSRASNLLGLATIAIVVLASLVLTKKMSKVAVNG